MEFESGQSPPKETAIPPDVETANATFPQDLPNKTVTKEPIQRYESLMLNNLQETEFKCQDSCWAIFFYITVAVNIALGVFYLYKNPNIKQDLTEIFNLFMIADRYKKDSKEEEINMTLEFNFEILLIGASVAVIFTILWMLFVQLLAGSIIKTCLIIAPIFFLFFGLISVPYCGPLVLFFTAIICLFMIVYAYLVWKRVKFAEVTIKIALAVFKEFKLPLLINILMIIFSLILMVIDILGFAGLYFFTGNKENIMKILVWVCFAFLLWHMFTYSNVSHATSCGVMATWLYARKTGGVTCSSYNRMMTLSFGSIAFGSMLEAICQTIRIMLSLMRQQAEDDNNLIAYVIICCIECCISIIGDILDIFNSYAYVHIAVYGKSYLNSAKETWNLFKSKGVDAIINDDLSSLPFQYGGIILIFLITSICYMYGGKEHWPSIIFAVIIGWIFYFGCVSILISYIKTLFVCWAEDPNTLKQNRPEKFAMVTNAARNLNYTVWY